MLRKRIALLLATVMMLTMFTGLTAFAGDEPAKPAKLTVWLQKTFNDEFNEAFAALFVEFGEANGINISVEIIDAAALRDTKLPAALEAGDYPNISPIDVTHYIVQKERGVLLNTQAVLDELAANGTTFIEAAITNNSVGGEPVAVPFAAQSWLLWYRKDLLIEAGFDGSPPATWEEMLEMAIATTDTSKGIYGYGMNMGATSSDHNNMMQSALWSYGGSVMKDNQINIDSPESRAAIEMIMKFLENGTVSPDCIAGDDMANNIAMLSGAACFIINIPTIANALKADAPEIWEHTGAAPVPAGPLGSFPLASWNAICLLNRSEDENYWAGKALAYAIDKNRLGPVLEMIEPAYGMAYAETLEMTEYMSDPVVAAHMEALMSGNFYNYPDPELTLERALLTPTSMFLNNIFASVVVDGLSLDEAIALQVALYESVLADIQ